MIIPGTDAGCTRTLPTLSSGSTVELIRIGSNSPNLHYPRISLSYPINAQIRHALESVLRNSPRTMGNTNGKVLIKRRPFSPQRKKGTRSAE